MTFNWLGIVSNRLWSAGHLNLAETLPKVARYIFPQMILAFSAIKKKKLFEVILLNFSTILLNVPCYFQ